MVNSFNVFRTFVRGCQKILGDTWPLRMVEHKLLKGVTNGLMAPLFIIGAPRTGSTLLYQLLIQNYNFSFFNNLQSFFFGSPALIAKLTRNIDVTKSCQQLVQSKYGYIPGLFAPSESATIFRHWFGDSDPSAHIADPARAIIRKTVVYLSATVPAPFIAKNLNNALRLATISAVLPETIFVWIKRHPLYASQSLIKMRRRLYGSDDIWASIKPPSYAKIIERSPFEQVVWQIKDIDDLISQYFAGKERARLIKIKYESLCQRPDKELDMIAQNYHRLSGLKLQRTESRETILLEARNKRQLPETEWKRLKETVNDIIGVTDSI